MIDKKIKELKALAEQIETEQNFDKVTECFTKAASIVKQTLGKTKDTRKRVLEVIADVDGFIEQELDLESPDTEHL